MASMQISPLQDDTEHSSFPKPAHFQLFSNNRMQQRSVFLRRNMPIGHLLSWNLNSAQNLKQVGALTYTTTSLNLFITWYAFRLQITQYLPLPAAILSSELFKPQRISWSLENPIPNSMSDVNYLPGLEHNDIQFSFIPAFFVTLSDHQHKDMNKYPEDLNSQIAVRLFVLIKHM